MIESLQHLPRPSSGQEALDAAFADFPAPLTPRQASIESQRCLYCHDAPCTRACPTDINVPGFIQKIAQDNIDGAALEILRQNIFGGSCGRVCPTEILCEQACVRNHDAEQKPILIGLLQRYAIDHMRFAKHPFARAAASGRRVAVVGAGPAGLSCAHRLAMLGHDVVVFEAQAKPGGLNEYGIARYKLTNDVAQREVAFLLEIGGIEIRHGVALGRDIFLHRLQADYDAVFLALGLGASRGLGLPGEDLPGIMPAVEYIAALRQTGDLRQLPLAKRCVVIGGGNTAIDMAVQMARLGADEVSIVYRRDLASMSATAHEQAVAKANQVRLIPLARPEAVLHNSEGGDDDGTVHGMRFQHTRIIDGNLQGTGAWFELDADAVFKAVGQVLDEASLADVCAQKLAREAGKIQVDGQFHTNLAKIYAGGDCVAANRDLTVEAVQHGKLAALAIHHDLLSPEAQSWPI